MSQRQRRDLLRPAAPGLRLGAEHEAVVLHRGAAAGGVDDDRVQPVAFGLAAPGRDVGAGAGHRRVVLAHVVGQRAAAAGALCHHHLDAEPGQQADRRLVDRGASTCWAQPASSATRARRSPCARWTCGVAIAAGGGSAVGRQVEHRAQALRQHRPAGDQPREAAGTRRAPSSARRNSAGRGSTAPSTARSSALVPGPAVGLLDVAARVIDQVHVVHAGRARGHAGQAGQAAVDVAHDLLGGRAARSPACP